MDRQPAASVSDRRRSGLRDILPLGESLWALTLLGIGFGAYRIATTMTLQQAHDPLGGRFIPVLLAVGLMGAAALVLLGPLVRHLLGGSASPASTSRAGGAATVGRHASSTAPALLERPQVRVLTMILIAVMFVSIMDLYRFVPGAIVGMAGSMMLLGERRPRQLVIVPVITAIVVFYIFTRFLLVRLP
jgi:hypothetical protein